jgi:hypothetical protein
MRQMFIEPMSHKHIIGLLLRPASLLCPRDKEINENFAMTPETHDPE